jgi:hypothetical protein
VEPEFLQKFLEMLAVIVDDDAPWPEKKAALKAEMGPEDETNVAEFVSWYEAEEPQADD